MSKIPPERMVVLQNILVKGNQIAKKLAKQAKVKNRLLRQFLAGRSVPDDCLQRLQRLRIRKAEREAILAVESVRNEIVVGYVKLVESIASKIADRYRFDCRTLISEGYLRLIDFVYGYDCPKFKFITYTQKGLYNELKRYVMMERNDGLPSHSSQAIELISKYYETEARLLRCGVQPTLERICEYLKLSKKRTKEMYGIMVKVNGLTSLCKHDQKEFDLPYQHSFTVDDVEFLDHLLATSNLTEYEQELIRSELDGDSFEGVAYTYGQRLGDAPQVFKKAIKKLKTVAQERYRLAS